MNYDLADADCARNIACVDCLGDKCFVERNELRDDSTADAEAYFWR